MMTILRREASPGPDRSPLGPSIRDFPVYISDKMEIRFGFLVENYEVALSVTLPSRKFPPRPFSRVYIGQTPRPPPWVADIAPLPAAPPGFRFWAWNTVLGRSRRGSVGGDPLSPENVRKFSKRFVKEISKYALF